MKILFLSALAEPELGGGSEITIWTLMRGIRKAGHECAILATTPEKGLKYVERSGIRVWLAGIRNLYFAQKKISHTAVMRLGWHILDSYNPLMQDALRLVLATEQPDIVSVHRLSGWSVAAWETIYRQEIPIVQVLHDHYLLCAKGTMFKNGKDCVFQCTHCRLLRITHPRLSNRVSAVVSVSRFLLKRHESLGYFRDVGIRRVIHNARDPELLALTDKPSDYEKKTILRIGFIGLLSRPKGVEQLINVFLRMRYENVELWIAGRGEKRYEISLHHRFADPRIRFLGWRKPEEFYPQVDVVVVPSLWQEPLGMVVAEAFAFGKAVIGSRRGGIPEMIQDGENGLIYEPNHADELHRCLQRFVDDSGLRERMSKAALASAKPYLDVDRWTDNYLKVYAQLTQRNATEQSRAT